MSIFDTITDHPRRNCPLCSETTTMAVLIQARRLDDTRQSKGKAISRSRNYCAEHGEALFVKLVEQAEMTL